MEAILKKDIIIKAGTVFFSAPSKTERYGDGHIECLVELTKDETGSFVCCIGNSDKEIELMSEYFEIKS